MIEINFDKLYRYPRIAEPCTICIPVEKGKIYSKDNVCVMQDGKPVHINKISFCKVYG